ncbi:hypothetical protein [Deinococcus sp. SL84]|uniref:hypothetical protein n=1 Tax=Deinococcus sp. SL84 TaxID=2994663 RepID=UPI0022757D7D|nr:hypothetical protein [Deinococcus sp. SL84]MCY1703907.1 hypothetical protein [Deinococcus sp. SL84]
MPIIRIRRGLATNSSSSHSMVVAPRGTLLEEFNRGDAQYAYSNDYRLTGKESKRHFLAGLLRDLSPELWGRSVLITTEELEPHLDEDFHVPDGINAVGREDWDTTERSADPYSPERRDLNINLPAWLTREINELCGLPLDTDLRGHTTHNSFGLPSITVPRAENLMGPDRTAWEVIKAIILDPQTVLFAPDENSWDEVEQLPCLDVDGEREARESP